MKTKFGYYYKLNPEREDDFQSNCKYVLDTNVLLDILRLGKDLAEKAITTLESNRDKIIIPYYVGKEYHKHFIDEVNEQLKAHNNAYNKVKIDTIFDAIINQIGKVRFSELERLEIKNEFKSAIENLSKKIFQRKKYYESLLNTHELHEKLANILNGTVLESFSKEEIQNIEKEGIERYENMIPPGYKDKHKHDNKYGDLIIWKEILRYAKTYNSDICFVSGDLKDDWYEMINGERKCPRYELQEEFQSNVPSKYFKLMTFNRFLEQIDKSYSPQQLNAIEEFTCAEDPEIIPVEKVSKNQDIKDDKSLRLVDETKDDIEFEKLKNLKDK